MRLGEIKALIYPDNNLSYNKNTVEYEVEIQYRDGDGTYVSSLYRGVTVNTLFGGVADRFHATYRPGTDDHSIGSKVLILCLAGDQRKAIIMGGIEDPASTRKEEKGSGHNLFFEFNGVKFTIDKDGEPELTFRGATRADGTLSDAAIPEAEGTRVKVTRDGNLTVATPGDAQFIRLNHANKKIEVLADTAWEVTVNGELRFGVGKDITISGSQKMWIGMSDTVNIESAGVRVGAATDKWLLASTYRDSESQMHNQMAGVLNSIQAGLAGAGSTLAAAGAALAVPVTGPATAGPMLATAGTALISLGAQFAALSGFIKTHEAKAGTFLSKKNWND